ncbi:UbiA family prenyltransferase [Sphingobacterium sp. MYb382]|uniref:UbiA family prenyltransferase n=1 Tax=Sphingobacterium sp. MYb382 TaxID=2745278 RepID=UPI0030A971C9
MQFLRKGYYFLVFTNLLIALAAAAQCALTYLVFDRPYQPFIILIEGAATLLLYNSSLLLAKPKNPAASPYLRTRWIFSHTWLMVLNMVIAAILLGYALFQVHLYSFLFLGFIGFISFLYSAPIIRREGKWGGLRQLPALKVFHIALVWALSSVALPAVELYAQGTPVATDLFVTLFVFKFVFLVICTLPFDIRDMAQDSYYHLKTIPTVLGERKAILLCYGLLLVHSLLLYFSVVSFPIKVGILATNLLVAFILRFFVFKKKEHYHYTYLLDLALVLQFVIVLLVLFIFSLLR